MTSILQILHISILAVLFYHYFSDLLSHDFFLSDILRAMLLPLGAGLLFYFSRYGGKYSFFKLCVGVFVTYLHLCLISEVAGTWLTQRYGVTHHYETVLEPLKPKYFTRKRQAVQLQTPYKKVRFITLKQAHFNGRMIGVAYPVTLTIYGSIVKGFIIHDIRTEIPVIPPEAKTPIKDIDTGT